MPSQHGNLADPDYEPTDEELQELAHAAFADVAARNRETLRKLHEEIAAMTKANMERLKTLRGEEPSE